MATPDVRVRLSAEGVAEVVAALKKIQLESEKTAGKQSRSFLGVNSVLRSGTRLLGALGIAVSAVSFANLIREGVQGADALGKLGQKVGASVENLSALSLAAKENDVDIQQLTQGMVLLNKRIAEAAEKNPQALATFRDLKIDPQNFKGKDAAEALDLVAKKLSAVEPGYRKSKLAQDVFGKSGANLIPLLNQLAEEGLGGLISRARELGVLIDDKAAAAVDRLSDGMDRLKLQAQVAGANFFAGFAGPVTESLSLISGEVSKSSDVWKSLGEAVGLTVEFLVGVVAIAVDAIFSLWRQAVTVTRSSARVMAEVLRGNFGAAAAEWSIALAEIESESKSVDERMKARLETLRHLGQRAEGPEPPPKKKRGIGDEDSSEALQRRGETARALLDQELQLVKLQAKLRNDAEKRAFDQGLIGVREYYGRRREIAIEEADAEITALLKKRALLETEVDPAKRETETGKIDAQLQAVRLERENDLANLTFEELDAVRNLARERLGVEQKILEAQGRRHEAAMLAIEEEVRQADELLRKQGVPEADRTAELDRLRGSLTAVAHFEETQRHAQAAMDELARAREAIQAQVDAGLLSQFQGEEQTLALERERLAVLQQLAEANLAAAEATGDPEKIAQAQGLADSVRGVTVATEGASAAMKTFQEGFEGAALDALTNFFDQGITGAKSLKDAFLGAVASMADALRRLATQALAQQIFTAIGAAFGRGGQVPAKKAAGGRIEGLGTTTSDSILARLSRGEFVVRAAVVQQPGVLTHLQELNRLGPRAMVSRVSVIRPELPAFAIGGLIGADGADGRAGIPREGRLQIGLEAGLVAKILESPEGQRIVLQTLGKNRLAARHALGR